MILRKREIIIRTLNNLFCEGLPQKILQEAFEGNLVEQNIEDEPASILFKKSKLSVSDAKLN